MEGFAMSDSNYGYVVNLGKADFDNAINQVADALKMEGFGVLTEIDVKATLKKKLNVDFKKYKILGACNPPLAHRALSNEPLIGLLLPCNVVVREDDAGSVEVSVINPREMFKVVENAELADIAGEVDAKLKRVIEVLKR